MNRLAHLVGVNKVTRGIPLPAAVLLSRRSFVRSSLAAGLGTTALRGHAQPAASPRILRITKSGFDGTVPGPEFQVKRGAEFAVRIINELEEPTAVHWHGVRLNNAMDGAPPLTQSPIAPGASFDCRIIPPDAGTFWYHPFRPRTPDLHGAFIVTENDPVDVDREATMLFAAKDGDRFTINGRAMEICKVGVNERLRLRLINTCLNKILRLQLGDLRCFVMAVDGQPAQPFVAHGGDLTLGPGNRMDVFVDCSLRSGQVSLITIQNTDRINVPIAKIAATTDMPPRAALRDAPKSLPPNPLPDRMDFGRALRVESVVGQVHTAKEGTPIFTAKRGRTVMLGVSNPTSENAYIHLHGHSFRLLDALDDGWKPFWLDTMPLAPGGKAGSPLSRTVPANG